MENVDAELHGWPPAPYRTKADTDASYVRLSRTTPGGGGGRRRGVGVASHNLFDVALALVLAEAKGRRSTSRCWPAWPMARPRPWPGGSGQLLLLRPRHHPPGLPQRPGLPGPPPGREHHPRGVPPARPRHGARQPGLGGAGRTASPAPCGTGGPCADPTRPDARTGPSPPPPARPDVSDPCPAMTVLERTGHRPHRPHQSPLGLRRPGRRPPPAPPTASARWPTVEAAVTRARGPGRPGRPSRPERRGPARVAADVMVAERAEAVAAMTVGGGQDLRRGRSRGVRGRRLRPVVRHGTELLASLEDEVESAPCGVVVVSPPWNFPYAIAAGGVLSAPAAGNIVILKPSPEAPVTPPSSSASWRRPAFRDGRVQLVAAPTARRPPADLPSRRRGGDPTGSWETARLFGGWTPGRRLLAETSGKNAMVVTATADVDQAVGDLVRSAFGHAVQKCRPPAWPSSRRRSMTAARSCASWPTPPGPCGSGRGPRPGHRRGSIVAPFTESLGRALTVLEPGRVVAGATGPASTADRPAVVPRCHASGCAPARGPTRPSGSVPSSAVMRAEACRGARLAERRPLRTDGRPPFARPGRAPTLRGRPSRRATSTSIAPPPGPSSAASPSVDGSGRAWGPRPRPVGPTTAGLPASARPPGATTVETAVAATGAGGRTISAG